MNLTELHSFQISDALYFHKELNPAIFNGDTMDEEVRQQLLLIAKDFIEHLGITDLDVQDITISGSNAAYTYTRHSDIDLHILVDMSNFADDDIYRELFDAKKIVYNDQHDIYINDYEVELYVQDANQPVISLGEYSVLHDKWIRLPRKRKANFDQNATKLKYDKLYKLAEFAYKSNNLHKVQNVLKNIKKYRQAGLDLNGEFGPENLAYKALRSKGVIDKLYEKLNELHSKKLSLPENKVIKKIKKDSLADALFDELNNFKTDEDYNPNGKPPGPEFKPTMPAGTVKVDVSDVYDWYKLGRDISNLDLANPKNYGKGPPSTIMAFGSEEEEHEYINALKKLGLTTTDIDPLDPKKPKSIPRQKVDTTYNVNENEGQTFAGRDPMSFKSPKGGTPTMMIVTGQGSRYLITNDGMVLRNKSFHANTGGEDQGLKSWSDAIEFYDPSELPGGTTFPMSVAKAVEKGLPVALSRTKDGKRALVITDGSQWRVAKISDIYKNVAGDDATIVATYSRTPKLNWNVLDYNLGANNIIKSAHPGSPVTHGMKLTNTPKDLTEVSGYIPSEKEKNKPQFKTALSVDVGTDAIKKNASAFGFKVSRAGIPPLLRK